MLGEPWNGNCWCLPMYTLRSIGRYMYSVISWYTLWSVDMLCDQLVYAVIIWYRYVGTVLSFGLFSRLVCCMYLPRKSGNGAELEQRKRAFDILSFRIFWRMLSFSHQRFPQSQKSQKGYLFSISTYLLNIFLICTLSFDLICRHKVDGNRTGHAYPVFVKIL
jgi:hypothetical protein